MFWFIASIILLVVMIAAIIVRKSFRRADAAATESTRDSGSVHRARLRTIHTSGLVASLAALLAVIAFLFSVIRIVPANVVGIPVAFGTIGKPYSSGMHFTAPWTNISELSTRTQELSMLKAADEGDKNKDDSISVIANGGGSMAVDETVRYRIEADKADDLFRQAGSMTLIKERFVRPDAQEVTRNIFGLYLAEEGYASKRGEVSQKVFDALKPRLAARGIVLDSVNIRAVNPEPTVLQAINDILKARNDATKAIEDQTRQNTEAETRKQVAEKDKTKTITDAQAAAEEIRLKSEAQATANAKIAASLTPELAQLQIAQACAEAIASTHVQVITGCGAGASTSGTGQATGTTSVIVDGRNG